MTDAVLPQHKDKNHLSPHRSRDPGSQDGITTRHTPDGPPGGAPDDSGVSPSPLPRYRGAMSETPRPQRPVFPEPPAAPSPVAAPPAPTAPPAKQRRWRDDLHLAHTIANKVDSLTQARFDAGNFTVETKSDLTPVTEADKEAEHVIREQLGRARGRDSVLGEELPTTGHSSRQWVIDRSTGPRTSCGACRCGPRSSASLRTASASSGWSRPQRWGGAGGPCPAAGPGPGGH